MRHFDYKKMYLNLSIVMNKISLCNSHFVLLLEYMQLSNTHVHLTSTQKICLKAQIEFSG